MEEKYLIILDDTIHRFHMKNGVNQAIGRDKSQGNAGPWGSATWPSMASLCSPEGIGNMGSVQNPGWLMNMADSNNPIGESL